MKKGLSVILALLMIFASCAISASSAASYKTIKGGFNYTYAKKVCASINTVRKKAKLKTLVYDNALTEAAMKRAAELDVKFSSYRPNKQYCSTAYKGALNLDENIASGPQTPAKVFDLWLNNMKQARTNIYRKTHTRIGIGCFYNEYGEFTWVLAMCSGKSGGACKTTGIKYVNVNVSLNSKVNTAYSTVKGFTAIKSVKAKVNKYVYDGKAHKPALVITDAKGKTVSSKFYKVTYPGTIKKIADYYIYVREYYRAKTYKVKVSVIPKSTEIKLLTPYKKWVKVEWNKIAGKDIYYEVQYATKKNFSDVQRGSSNTSFKNVVDLKPNTLYYMRLRTYTFGNYGGFIYSKWSKTLSVRTLSDTPAPAPTEPTKPPVTEPPATEPPATEPPATENPVDPTNAADPTDPANEVEPTNPVDPTESGDPTYISETVCTVEPTKAIETIPREQY